MKEDKKELLKPIFKIAAAAALFVFVLVDYKSLVNVDVRGIVSAAPSLPFALLCVLLVYLLKGLTLVVPASLVYVSVGMAFSPQLAVPISLVGILLEFTVSFLLGLFLGGDYVGRLLAKQKYGRKILELSRSKKDLSVFLLRLVPVFPLDLVSLFLGADRYPFGKYLLFSFLGLAPRVVLFTVLGDKAYDYIPMKLLLAGALAALPVLAVVLAVRSLVQRKKRRGQVRGGGK